MNGFYCKRDKTVKISKVKKHNKAVRDRKRQNKYIWFRRQINIGCMDENVFRLTYLMNLITHAKINFTF